MTGKKPQIIIWDFDGTLIPNDPYDSEQSLMMYKLYEAGEKTPVVVRALARALIFADQKEHLRKVFKQFYIRLMKGTSNDIFDPVCTRLAAKLAVEDRQALIKLSTRGYRMMVLSCGTVNLSERTLEKAEISDCFQDIAGNRFEIKNGQINGMTLHVANPEDKVRHLVNQRLDPKQCIAVGDGYTDIPLLDWAANSVIVDRTGSKKAKYAHKN